MTNNEDIFWLNDFSILFKNDNYLYFFPSKYMTRNQQLNSLSRYSIYLFVVFFILSNNKNWLYLPIFIILICVMLYFIEKNDKQSQVMQSKQSEQYDIKEL